MEFPPKLIWSRLNFLARLSNSFVLLPTKFFGLKISGFFSPWLLKTLFIITFHAFQSDLFESNKNFCFKQMLNDVMNEIFKPNFAMPVMYANVLITSLFYKVKFGFWTH